MEPYFRRLRIGISHPAAGPEEGHGPLLDMLAAIAAEAEWLADGDDPRFMSEVALRMQQE